MRKTQRGVTLLGWIVLLIPVAIVVYGGIRVTPHYLNYFRVLHALETIKGEVGGDPGAAGAQLLRQSLEKRFDIEGIEKPSPKDVDLHREGDHWVAGVDYDDSEPLFGNISLTLTFTRQVELR